MTERNENVGSYQNGRQNKMIDRGKDGDEFVSKSKLHD